jgi:uncharacterized membrane protein
MQETPDVLIFLGRFHPLVIHLPIGFLCLAILIEFFFRKQSGTNLQSLVRFIWLLAALSSTLSVVLGYFLSLQGGYDEKTLSWHKWGGIMLACFVHFCYFWKKYSIQKPISRFIFPVSTGICTLLLIVTGHNGGSLTHGSDYLSEYKPESFSELFGISAEHAETKKINSLDSADIFTDAIQPILKSKCVSCHNTNKKKGGMILSSFDEILKGGEDGPGVVAGNLEKSGIYSRITLPEDDKKFMPANGKKPLTKDQIAIIKWWIEMQAPKTGMISALKPDSTMSKTFVSYFGINENKSTLDIEVPPANANVINELTNAGFQVAPLAEKTNLLQATLNTSYRDKAKFDKLAELKDQLAWLKINNAGKLDEELKTIGRLTNLRRLTLNNNDITDQNINELLSLSNLEYLNLYATKISDSGVEILLKMKKLKQLYVGKTNVTPVAMDSLSKKYPDIRIIYKEADNEAPIADSLLKK